MTRGAATDRGQLYATLETHRRLGFAYGYPACCVDAFCDAHVETVLRRHVWRSALGHDTNTAVVSDDGHEPEDPVDWGDNGLAIARAAARTDHFDPRLAAIPGALGASAASTLRHLPCRFDCTASRDLAEALLADLALTDGRRHRRLRGGLARPVWVDTRGHAHIATSAHLSGDRWHVVLPRARHVDVACQPRPGRPQLPLLLPFHEA